MGPVSSLYGKSSSFSTLVVGCHTQVAAVDAVPSHSSCFSQAALCGFQQCLSVVWGIAHSFWSWKVWVRECFSIPPQVEGGLISGTTQTEHLARACCAYLLWCFECPPSSLWSHLSFTPPGSPICQHPVSFTHNPDWHAVSVLGDLVASCALLLYCSLLLSSWLCRYFMNVCLS